MYNKWGFVRRSYSDKEKDTDFSRFIGRIADA